MASAAHDLPDPPSELVLDDVEQLKTVSDPVRLQLLDRMTDDPRRGWTAKELAEALATKQTKLYHHLGLLEERGFIRVAGTRVVSGILEKRYQVAARSFRVDRTLLTGAGAEPAMSKAIDAVFEKTRIELVEGLRSGVIDPESDLPDRRRFGLWATHARLSPASVKRVMRLVEKLAEVDTDQDPEGAEYGLLVGFYPRVSRETDR